MSLTRDQLASFAEDRLFRYFCRHARYSAEMPRGNNYFIRFGDGGMAICCSDTHDLWDEFKKAVEQHRTAR